MSLTGLKMQLITPRTSYNNELSVASDPFDFANPPFSPKDFAEALVKIMIKKNGIGLAAIQVGMPYQVFTVRSDPIQICFNPKIVDLSGEEVLADEGCLSFPGMSVKVKRFEEVRVRFQNFEGKFVTRKLAGLAARVVQHEIDHVNGILFYNRANKFHRDQALRRWERALKAHNRAPTINSQKEIV